MTERGGPLPDLWDVTLFAASSIGLAATVTALRRSQAEARFGRTVLFSDQVPAGIAATGIEWREISPLRSKADYSRFMLQELAGHVATSHALCVQWDGFVIDGANWAPDFLNYDYIGAVWPHFADGHNVGNGGFSLRSKRLLDHCRQLPFDPAVPEDILICRTHRARLEALGMKFAPEAVARRFAFERLAPTGGEFGFHGAFNLVKRLSRGDAFKLLQGLEPEVLTRSEHVELLRWALRNARFRLAIAILFRLS